MHENTVEMMRSGLGARLHTGATNCSGYNTRDCEVPSGVAARAMSRAGAPAAGVQGPTSSAWRLKLSRMMPTNKLSRKKFPMIMKAKK